MSLLSIASLAKRLGQVTLKKPSSVLPCLLRVGSVCRPYSSSAPFLKDDSEKPSTGRSAKLPVIPPQQQEWLAFQESIAVDGFDSISSGTGGNSKASNKAAKELEEERQRLTQAGGGLYPPLRWSPSETERLLQEAYANLPERAGPRRTRRNKRNFQRWHAVRKIRKKYKKHMIRHHHAKMEKRAQKVQLVQETLAAAPGQREQDRTYQAAVVRRWAETVLAPGGAAADTTSKQQVELDT